MKQKQRLQNLVNSLKESLNQSNINTVELFAATLQSWLVINRHYFEKATRNLFPILDFFADADLSEYPVHYASISLGGLQRLVAEITPRKQADVAARLADIIWDLIAYKTTLTCPQCKDDELRVLQDTDTGRLVLACDICLWSQWEDGEPRLVRSRLEPAKLFNLHDYIVKEQP
jgi:hypothetical protein